MSGLVFSGGLVAGVTPSADVSTDTCWETQLPRSGGAISAELPVAP